METRFVDDDDTRPVACDNCDWHGPANATKPVTDLYERIEPGGDVPAGECPTCGALTYLTPQLRVTLHDTAEAFDTTLRIDIIPADNTG